MPTSPCCSASKPGDSPDRPPPTVLPGAGWTQQWSERLEDARRQLGSQSPGPALELLKRSHRFQRQADPDHVHSSWWIRALQDESPAVRRFVMQHGPAQILAAVRDRLDPERDPVETPARDPAVTDWVFSLTGERLVGGEPICWDEPPAIVALAALSARKLYYLVHATGQAKSVLAEDPQTLVAGRPLDDGRKEWFQAYFLDRFGSQEARLKVWAGRDLQEAPGTKGVGKRRGLAILGLSTIARLLTGGEPYRVRWALQHVPYPVAKRIRSLISNAPTVSKSVLRLEGEILQAAWTRLALENRLVPRYLDQAVRPDHAR